MEPSTTIPMPTAAASSAASSAPNANGAARATSAKVAPHIIPTPTSGPVGSAPRRPAQFDQTATVQGGAQRPAQQVQSNIPELDWGYLTNVHGAAAEFQSQKLGMFLTNIASAYAGGKIDIKFDQATSSYDIELGKAKIKYIVGLRKTNSFLFRAPTMVQNPQGYAMSGNPLTQFAAAPLFGENKENESAVVIYEDEVENLFPNISYFLTKIAFPEQSYSIKEAQYLSPKSGFNFLDTKVNPDIKETIKAFYADNTVNSLVLPANEYLAVSVTKSEFNGMGGFGFGGGFGGGFGQQMGGFGGGFQQMGMNPMMGMGMNGGFGINAGMPAQTTQILGCVRYQLSTNEQTKRTTARIVEFCELKHLISENLLKYMILYFTMNGYEVEFDLDLSKMTQNVMSVVKKYMTQNNGMMYGPMGFASLSTYFNLNSKELRRIHPQALSLKTFTSIHTEYEKDPKFPKDLKDYESKVKFESYKTKAGYQQVIHAGEVRCYIDPRAYQALMMEYNMRMEAGRRGTTYEELKAAFEAQTVNGQQNGQQQAAPNASFGFGGGMNQGFGGGFGGGFGQQMGGFGGGFGAAPQMGMNPMMGGFGAPMGMNPMMGGYGQQAYPMQQGGQKKGAKGAAPQPGQMQGNPYMMGGMNPMMGGFAGPQMGMNPMMGGYGAQMGMNPMMGGMNPGYPQQMGMNPMGGYMPGVVAGGAFPANAPAQGAGQGYIPV